jgi:putative peptide zinc metalloprotease protein
MSATAETSARDVAQPRERLARAEGVELLGDVHGSGYREGAALVRRADGQMVQVGPLLYALLESIDGRRDTAELASRLSEAQGRRLGEEHVGRLAEKLAAQGLLAGTEDAAPPRPNPLLALRWKVLVTSPAVTDRLTRPFTLLFRPWAIVPILAAFAGVFWFVLVHKGVASATSQAFQNPELLLLVFGLAVASAGFHELGHAAACRYGGARPSGMGCGLYLVWPAFYTDVTDAYRLPRGDRLRVDLGGLYFNAIIAVATVGVWLVWRADALLLLVALQLIQMVQQLSPMIRADGYHILADLTGVPDLYAHIGPTLRRLLPWRRREPSALTGRARLIVTVWVLVVVPLLLLLAFGAIVLLPRLLATAWESGRQIVASVPDQAEDADAVGLLTSLLQLVALALPVAGTILIAERILRSTIRGALAWSDGRPGRRLAVGLAGIAAASAALWAWWPSGQYEPIRASDRGSLAGVTTLVSSPRTAALPAPSVELEPGTHLAISMIPVGGATDEHPALFVIPGDDGEPAVAIVLPTAPAAEDAVADTETTPSETTTEPATAETPTTETTPSSPAQPAPEAPAPAPAAAFPFELPSAPKPGDTQALSVNTTDGAVKYTVAYALVTVSGNAPVTNTNSAFAFASCKACTTVAVSFQVVLIVGRSSVIAPINAAGALNVNCPACVTTAIADQLVVTLTAQPSAELQARLLAALRELDELPALGTSTTAVVAKVVEVQERIEDELEDSGLLANPPPPPPAPTSTTSTATTTTPATTATTTAPASTEPTSTTATTTTPASTEPASTTPTATTPTSTEPASTSTTATTPSEPPPSEAPPEDPAATTTTTGE